MCHRSAAIVLERGTGHAMGNLHPIPRHPSRDQEGRQPATTWRPSAVAVDTPRPCRRGYRIAALFAAVRGSALAPSGGLRQRSGMPAMEAKRALAGKIDVSKIGSNQEAL
jgi:hypothetical protein